MIVVVVVEQERVGRGRLCVVAIGGECLRMVAWFWKP